MMRHPNREWPSPPQGYLERHRAIRAAHADGEEPPSLPPGGYPRPPGAQDFLDRPQNTGQDAGGVKAPPGAPAKRAGAADEESGDVSL